MADLVKFTDTSASPETFTYTTNDIVSKGVVGQTDVPGLTAEQQQRKVEELVRKVVMPLVNKNADDTCTVSTYDTNADSRVNGADEADKLTTARTVGLTDADGTNAGTGVSFDGTANVTLKLPATIKANIAGTVTGNADTATALETARTINVADNDASNTGVAASFDGTGNAVIKLPATVKASIVGNATGNAGTATKLQTARTLAVQDFDGSHTGAGASFDGSGNATMKLPGVIGAAIIGDVNGNAASADKWKTARNFTVKDADSTNSGVASSADGSAAVTLPLPSTIKASITGNVTGNVSGSAGSCTGNAATATALATARNITIGSKTNSFDGSAPVTYTLADIGAPAIVHGHAESDVTNLVTDLAAKLPLAGGTMTGDLTLYGAPTLNLHAATKKYVDDSISSAGGGDMLKATYDSNADGTVNAADTAAACTGNAATATALATARTINVQDADATNTGTGASFDGSGNATMKLPATIKAALTGNVTGNVTGNASGSSGSCTGNAATATTAGACSGNAATATKLATARNIVVGGKTNSFDGSANITFTLTDVGAATASHVHGNLTSDGKIGTASGKIVTTGTGGVIQAQTISEAGLTAAPSSVSSTGTISVTVADNTEYSYTAVTSLTLTGAVVNAHGFVTFAASAPSITVSGFTASGGDDITGAAASEVWEFSVYAHNSGAYIVWKNWSA